MPSTSSTVTVVEIKRRVADATVGVGRSRGVDLRMQISIIFIVRWNHTAFLRLLPSDGSHVSVTATPAASITVDVVESQWRGD